MINYKKEFLGDFDEIISLYESVGWTGYTSRLDMLKKSFDNSLLTIFALDNDKLVGIVRVVGDGASLVYIQDILVLPSYQRRGIGKELIERVLFEYPEYYQINLLTAREEKTMNFYESLGFSQVKDIDCVAYTYLK